MLGPVCADRDSKIMGRNCSARSIGHVSRCPSSKRKVGRRNLRTLPVQAAAPQVPPTAGRLHFAERALPALPHPRIVPGPLTYPPGKMPRPNGGRQWRCQGGAGCRRETLWAVLARYACSGAPCCCGPSKDYMKRCRQPLRRLRAARNDPVRSTSGVEL